MAFMSFICSKTLQRALKRLLDDGKIEHVGVNRFDHYVIK